MRRMGEIDEDLKVAIDCHDHVAYAAAARVGWPNALLELKECIFEQDFLSSQLLRRMREVAAADQLAMAVDAYLANPPNRLEALAEIGHCLNVFRELRGLVLGHEG